MKKILCALVLFISLCFTSAMAESCKYYSPDSPCDVIWWVDTENRLHCRACRNHVEDKEDMYSYVQVTGWAACTLDDGGECTTCGWDYVKDSSDDEYTEMYMLEFFYVLTEMYGYPPVEGTGSGDYLSLSFTDAYFEELEAMGIPVPERMYVSTKYTLNLPGGSSYAHTGEAVTPAVKVEASAYGPGAWMEKYGLLTIGQPTYTNNTAIGTATVKVEISVKNGKSYTLSKNFAIEKMAERVPGDADGDGVVGLADALAILQQGASVNNRNADVTGDGVADIHDALRIFQHEAGWDVTLK